MHAQTVNINKKCHPSVLNGTIVWEDARIQRSKRVSLSRYFCICQRLRMCRQLWP